MALMDQIVSDLKEAMKSKDEARLLVLRSLKASAMNSKIEKGAELTDEEFAAVIQKAVKQRRDSIEQFASGGRDDLAANERAEIEILQKYLPEQLSPEELKKIVQETVAQVGATSKKDMGKVMGALMPKVKGRADGKAVQQIVQLLLP